MSGSERETFLDQPSPDQGNPLSAAFAYLRGKGYQPNNENMNRYAAAVANGDIPGRVTPPIDKPMMATQPTASMRPSPPTLPIPVPPMPPGQRTKDDTVVAPSTTAPTTGSTVGASNTSSSPTTTPPPATTSAPPSTSSAAPSTSAPSVSDQATASDGLNLGPIDLGAVITAGKNLASRVKNAITSPPMPSDLGADDMINDAESVPINTPGAKSQLDQALDRATATPGAQLPQLITAARQAYNLAISKFTAINEDEINRNVPPSSRNRAAQAEVEQAAQALKALQASTDEANRPPMPPNAIPAIIRGGPE